MLEAVRQTDPTIRFYQAASSEMFGKVRETPQTELTAFHPRSPYGVAKAYGHFMTVNYRESYGMFAGLGHPLQPRVAAPGLGVCHPQGHRRCGPHQAGPGNRVAAGQPRRQAGLGLRRRLREGDVVDAPAGRTDDFVVATGVAHSVREVCEVAFGYLGLDYQRYVIDDAELYRPAEVDHLVGDASRARAILDWAPGVDFNGLIEMMAGADLARLKVRADGGAAVEVPSLVAQ